MPESPPRKTTNRWNYRWLSALVGLGVLIFGQIQIASEKGSQNPPLKLGEWLNREIFLSIPSIDNVLIGLPFLIGGLFLLWLSTRSQVLLPQENPIEHQILRSFRLLKPYWIWISVGTLVFLLLIWQVNALDYHWVMAVQWLLILLLFAVISAYWDRQRMVSLSPASGRVDILWMMGLVILGILVGTYRLQGLPDMLIGDEGAFFTAARDIALGDLEPPVFSNGVYTFPVFSSLIQGLIMRVFGISLWGWRFSSVLAGTITILPVYLLGKEALNRKVAVFASLALIFSPYFLAFSRLGYNNIQALFITSLSLYWLYLGVQRSSNFYTLLAGMAAGFGFYTYFAARMTIVIGSLFIILLFIIHKTKFKPFFTTILLFVFGAILVIGPYFAYGMQHDTEGMGFKVFESVFFNTFNGRLFFSDAELSSVVPIFKFGGNELFYNPKIYLILLGRGLIRTLLIFQKPWLISEHFIASPLTGSVGVIFYIIGLFLAFRKFKEPRHLLFLCWFVVTIFGLSILNTVPPRHTHMVSIIPVLCLMTGIGVYWLAGVVYSFSRKLYWHRSWIYAVLIISVIVGGIVDYFIIVPQRYKPNPDQVISWTGLYAKDEVIFFVFSSQAEVNNIQPYLITEVLKGVRFQSISTDGLIQLKQTGLIPEKAIFFYQPTSTQEVEPILADALGEKIAFRDFYSPDGIPVISAGMNIPFIFERDRSILLVLQESYGRTPLILFSTMLCSIFAITLFIPSRWLLKLPRTLRRSFAWVDTPVDRMEQDVPSFAEVEAFSSATLEPEPTSEPPVWLQQIFHAKETTQPEKLKLEAHRISSSTSRDFYLHLRLPRPQLPWQHLPTGLRLAIPKLVFPSALILLSVLVLAIFAQILISRQLFLYGSIFYLLAVSGVIFWSLKNKKWQIAVTNQVLTPPRAELILGLLLLAFVVFSRLYDLGYRVYGLEADETKWTVQSWLSSILRVDYGEFSSMHYQYLPVDFWVRSLFLRLFGLNFLSARIESAVFSIISIIALYFIVRRLTSSPSAAILASILYAFSYLELNASHQALHNTTLEPWMMIGLLLLIAALQDHKLWQYQFAGIVLALGMLTYETFYPTVVLALLSFILVTIHQLVKNGANLKQSLQRILLFAWPLVLTFLLFTQKYLQARHGYHFGWLETYSGSGTNITGALSFIIRNSSDLFRTIFYGVVFEDSLLRWNGPLVNVLLLPFVAIGLAFSLSSLRKPSNAFVIAWFAINILAAPILLGSVWPRVLYTAFAPLMIWAALGLHLTFAALRSWLHRKISWVVVPIFMTFIALIVITDHRIFTSEITDPIDRVKRRELADITSLAAQEDSFMIFPFIPTQNDTVELETHVILFSIAGARGLDLGAMDQFKQVPFDQLMLFLWEHRAEDGILMIYDKSLTTAFEERSRFLDILKTCYQGFSLDSSGTYFDVYRFNELTLSNPLCYHATPPIPLSPREGATISPITPIRFSWDVGEITSTGFTLQIEKQETDSYFLEAEEAFQTSGWYAASEYTTNFSGTGFLLDNWQSQEAFYAIDIQKESDYRIWIRSYKRRYNDQQNYFILGNDRFDFSGASAPLDQWCWESVGVFHFPAGNIEVGLGRTYGEDEMFSVFIDSILITSKIGSTPEDVHIWQPAVSQMILNKATTEFIISEGFPTGQYRWSVRVFDGERLIDSHGNLGTSAPYQYFNIIP